MGNNYAWITCLSNLNYIDSTIVLAKSLIKVKSNYKLVVLLHESLKKYVKLLQNYNCDCILYPFDIPDADDQHLRDLANSETAVKFYTFVLDQYDKLIHIDSDAIFIKNCDDFFDYPNHTLYCDYGEPDTFMFLIEPKIEKHKFRQYLTTLFDSLFDETIAIGVCFQDSYYAFPLKDKVDITFNFPLLSGMTPKMDEYNLTIFLLDEYRIIHFCCRPKPWDKSYKNLYISWDRKDKIIEDYIQQINTAKEEREQYMQ